jgi:hypothetical protein
MRPFVVLLHQLPSGGPRESHWDWMFDVGETLETWATPIGEEFFAHRQAQWPCERLADHRRDYLEYTGPVSRHRGTVSQVFRGQYELLAESSAARVLDVDHILGSEFPRRWLWEIVAGSSGHMMKLTAIEPLPPASSPPDS